MDSSSDFFSSHPNTKERMEYLRAAAIGKRANGQTLGSESYRKAMAPWWPQLIDDQVKLNQFGPTEFLLESMARGKGEPAKAVFARLRRKLTSQGATAKITTLRGAGYRLENA